jgi:hypothetical protein
MGTYNIHAGHAPSNSGGAGGAVGILNESNEARKVKDQVIFYLRNNGHTVYDCTSNQGLTQNGVLKDIVSKCNAHSVDLDVSIHFNAGGGKGVEVWCYDNGTSAVASRICNAIAGLGFANRGVKYSKQLYVLSTTKSPAILIECCFVDSQTDANIYNVDKMASAIVEGILNKSINTISTPKKYNVQINSANYSDAQKWKITKDFNNFSQLYSKINLHYLSVDGDNGASGTNVCVMPGDRIRHQDWLIQPIKRTDKILGETVMYEFLPSMNGNLRLTVLGSSPKDGTNVLVEAKRTDYAEDSQHWFIRTLPDGYCNIINVATGKCLDVAGVSK